MKKEALTIHIEQLLKFALIEESTKRKSKNLNTLIAEVLKEFITEKQIENKTFEKLKNIEEQVLIITQVLEVMNSK